jgi:thiamine-phosphate pyrophosphorylase
MARAHDLSVYFVTDPDLCARHGVVATALAAVRGGATLVQLRDPAASGRALYESARALVQALAPAGIPLIVNDRPDVALAAGAAGVHVGQSDLPVPVVRQLIGPDMILGLSITDAQLADVPWELVDHIGAGPVFATSTKADAAPAMGIAGLKAICDAAPCPVVAIGGIGMTQVAACITAGAAGVAVVSAIASAPDPEEAARQLAARFLPLHGGAVRGVHLRAGGSGGLQLLGLPPVRLPAPDPAAGAFPAAGGAGGAHLLSVQHRRGEPHFLPHLRGEGLLYPALQPGRGQRQCPLLR